MGLNLKGLLVTLIIVSTTSIYANVDDRYLTIEKIQVSEISQDVLNQNKLVVVSEARLRDPGPTEPTEGVRNVIATGRDLVALGEDIYNLILKGKPKNTTSYEPISVVPKIGKEAVDVFDLENFRTPTKRSFKVTYTNTYGMEVVSFTYSIIYSDKGSYNGTGAYLTGVQVVPESVKTLWGYEFNATMKLGGMMNHGTRENPVAGVTLLLEYTVSSPIATQTTVDTYSVTGNGAFKKYK